ncbi:TonB-dependent receptor domain-containing protein [Parasediminibacterium sp. JCM 36343]|uniref:TonB-dependent receptor domain-containing protein n=1 Tax=Parasediminibacterium sp. JCM 36343 TaxID=3374279 RepID=UPI00397A227E
MRKFYVILFLVTLCLGAIAQYPNGAGRAGGAGRSNLSMGHFYGKIVDSKNKGIAGVTIQLTGNKFDTVTKQLKLAILKTVVTEPNGDFNLDGLSLMGRFTLKASSVGYKKLEMPISFGIAMPAPGTTPDMQKIAAMADKDLGNLKLEVDAAELAGVTVTTTTKPLLELGIDKKVFNVDKNLSSTGQTATEIMKSIPSVSVDIDGNVTLRNATPTLFIDGRPTTLTLDQIPADIIDKVEIITNPSAKYDASGGNAGILNIVIKKNRKNGYNGNLRAGVDSRGKVNGGGDINYRQNKVNFTGSVNYNQRKSISKSISSTTYFGQPNTDVYSNTDGTNNGHFQFYRAGLDYFVDNRNTISIAGNYAQGKFNNVSSQAIDSTQPTAFISSTSRNTGTDFHFENFGGQLSYKHLFAKDGHTFSADANYNSSTNSNFTSINSNTFLQGGTPKYPQYQQLSNADGYNHFFTLQADYENQLTDDSKIEAGARAAIRNYKTNNFQFNQPDLAHANPLSSSRYKFDDQVYAAYATYSFRMKKIAFQLGFRAESSNYNGKLYTLSGADSTPVKVSYPLSLFPSAFITYKIDDKQDLQLNYSRRINRPNFFQLLPAYDFTDPQNPSVGNPELKPEFTNSLEWSYSNNYTRNSNFLATAYFKYSTDLITRYVYKDINRNIQAGATSDSLYYTSYINANNSYTYGLELTDKMPVAKWWDILLNVNFYDSKINATIPGQTVSNSILSWFAKINNTFKIAKGVSLQLSGESRSKTLLPQGSGGNQGGGGRGGGMFGGGPQTSAQGYNLPRYFDVDVALRKDWTWTKGRSGSLTLGMNDIFRSKTKTHTDAVYFTQDTERYRDLQVARLNFSYRFGKFDVNLFKRKNTKADQGGGMDMGTGN